MQALAKQMIAVSLFGFQGAGEVRKHNLERKEMYGRQRKNGAKAKGKLWKRTFFLERVQVRRTFSSVGRATDS